MKRISHTSRPSRRRSVFVALVTAILMQAGGAASASAATTLNVTTTADVNPASGVCAGTSTTVPSPLSLREAICIANNAGGTATINIPAGTYKLSYGELQPGLHPGQNVTMIGAGAATTIIDAQGLNRVLDVDANTLGGVTGSLSKVTVTGGQDSIYGGAGIGAGSGNSTTSDVMTIDSVIVTGNESNKTTPTNTSNVGGGMAMVGGKLTVTNSTFSNNTAHGAPGSGLAYTSKGLSSPDGLLIDNTTFDGNYGTQTIANIRIGGALKVQGNATSSLVVQNSRFTNNSWSSTNGTAAGAAIFMPNGNLTLTGSSFSNNTLTSSGSGSVAGADVYVDAGSATLHYNRFAGNNTPTSSSVALLTTGTPKPTNNATENWWGCNAGPGSAGCDGVNDASITTSPRLTLSASASPASLVGPNATSTITAGFLTDSAGSAVSASNLGAFNGLSMNWSDPTPSGATIASSTSSISSGSASVGYNSDAASGSGHVLAGFDSESVAAPLTVATQPSVTSADHTAFTVASPGSFGVTTTGSPTPSLSKTGSLPSGVSFTDNGNGTATLSGTPAAGTAGSYPITINATNSAATAHQSFTLTVNQPPAITSADHTTFTIGTLSDFTATTTGSPTPSLSETGSLPSGVGFTDNGDGTASLSGTPAAGSAGSYPITINATNAASTAHQSFTLTVGQAPAITANPSDSTVAPGQTASFSAAASGYPAPSVQWQKDSGSGFANIAGATSTTYSFTAGVSDNGSQYRAVFTNGNGSATSDPATLTVQQAPSFTSADTATFARGTSGSFTITAGGTPAPTISTSDSLPSWLHLDGSTPGQATLSGTPPAGSGGTLPITLKADNGISPAASQSFTLTVDEAPAITASPSDSTVNTGETASFTAAASGYPSPSVQWQKDTGSGFTDISGATSPTLSFTAGAADNHNQYRAVFTNGNGSATSNPAALTVRQAPSFTSANSATFVQGQSGTFTASASGTPTPTLSTSDPLPSWLHLDGSTPGQAILSGTPPTGSGGTYAITLRADNGVDPAATQSFTLTVDEGPAITTNPQDAIAAPGQTASFTAAGSGYPSPAVQWQKDSGSGFADISGATSPTLSFTAGAGDDGTRYRAVFTNTTGSATTTAATLKIQQAPSFTSADASTFSVGQSASFTATATGTPTPTISATGTLPSWLQLDGSTPGQATLSGTPPAGSGGTYPIALKADNGVSPAATQSFTLTVDEAPAVKGADPSFTIGSAGSSTYSSSGYPAATLSETGSLPSGVSFTPNPDGTATLTGTPANGSKGSYPITIRADNSSGHDSHGFTITVAGRPQAITITSEAPSPAQAGHAMTLAASATSGLPVQYSLDPTSSGCSLTTTSLHFDHAGTCVVDFNQSGDSGTWAPAPQVKQTIPISAQPSAIQLTPSIASPVYGQPLSATATVSTGNGPAHGSVQFSVDGTNIGAPIALADGSATSPPLTGSSGQPLGAGKHTLAAAFSPSDPSTEAPSQTSLNQPIAQAATTLTLSTAGAITATIHPVGPGAGLPTGSVSFAIAGKTLAVVQLQDGVAHLSNKVPPGRQRQLSATYSGDGNFTSSSASLALGNPTLTARIWSAHPRNRSGWYRTPVRISFSCTPGDAPLNAQCPRPVTLTRDGAGQSVTRTITATDGGIATASVRAINIDRTPPHLQVLGISQDAVSGSSHRQLRCRARDSGSGVSRCQLQITRSGQRISYRASAADRAGNVTVKSGHYTLARLTLLGLAPHEGTYTVHAGRTYQLIAWSNQRPSYLWASVYPNAPGGFGEIMRPAGPGRWAIGVTIDPRMTAHRLWTIGARTGGRTYVMRLRVQPS